MVRSLDALLEAAQTASPNDRIDLRDEIAAHGEKAIDAVRPWLADAAMWRFAVLVMGRAAELGARQAGVEALRSAGLRANPAERREIDRELARIKAPAVVRSGAFGPIDYEAIRDRLIEAARRHELVYYSDLAKATGREMKGPNWAVHIGRVLGRISEDEADAGRPLLSAIVVSRDSKMPGSGFFTLGQQRRLVRDGEDEEAFARRQTERVYEYWGEN